MRTHLPILDRFWAKVAVGGPTDCWPWLGTPTRDGYGRFMVWRPSNTKVLAHRFAYELLVGPILMPTLDHLCRNRFCCNPAHLEPTTRAVNTARGQHPLAVAGRTNTCPRGHSLATAYLRKNGRRLCRPCNDMRNSLR